MYSLAINGHSLGRIIPESQACEYCEHWRGDWHNKIHADRGDGSTAWVGQCVSLDDGSPAAELERGIPYVFTPADGWCPAFAMLPDVAEENEAIRHTYRQLDRDRYRETL